MTINEWLTSSTKVLAESYISSARLDCLILLEDALGKDRAWLLANGDEVLSVKTQSQLKKAVKRRASHEPLAYIRGKSEFFGREFIVSPATLQPRPETETMIELLSKLITPHFKNYKARPCNMRIVDVGTGSGCLAVTAKLEWPEAIVHAIEINKDALKIARQNALKLGADIEFQQGDLLQPLLSPKPLSFSTDIEKLIVLANLPYVPDNHTINQAAMQEPKLAIFGGSDGLDLYRQMFEQLTMTESKGLRAEYVLTESLPFQHKDLAQIANSAGYKLLQAEDFIQIFTLL